MNDSTFTEMCLEFKNNIVEMHFEKRYSHGLALASKNGTIASFMYAERYEDFRKFQKSLSTIGIDIFLKENDEVIRP